MYFNIREKQAEKFYRSLLSNKGTSGATHSICLNDRVSNSSNELDDFDIKLRAFLDSYYPEPSDAEFYIPTKSQLSKMVSGRNFTKIYDTVGKLSPLSLSINDEEKLYLNYYYGIAGWFLYQEKEQRELLENSHENLLYFCEKNPKHTLAHNYLEQVRTALFESSHQDQHEVSENIQSDDANKLKNEDTPKE